MNTVTGQDKFIITEDNLKKKRQLFKVFIAISNRITQQYDNLRHGDPGGHTARTKLKLKLIYFGGKINTHYEYGV